MKKILIHLIIDVDILIKKKMVNFVIHGLHLWLQITLT
nr:MAG TPA: hypothetical protein [Caudoviricetes sp.]